MLWPIAAFQVSGEDAIVTLAAASGSIAERRAVRETLGVIKRSSADLIRWLPRPRWRGRWLVQRLCTPARRNLELPRRLSESTPDAFRHVRLAPI